MEKPGTDTETPALSGICSTTLFAEFVRKHNLAVEHLTETQLADALRQAIEAGDFIRYVHANKQMVVYVPFNEVSRLRLQYNELLMAVGNKYEGESRHETALRYIQMGELLLATRQALRDLLPWAKGCTTKNKERTAAVRRAEEVLLPNTEVKQ
jgi:hypothetical protein